MSAQSVLTGLPFPLGATARDGGVNFAVFAEDAERVELCLFDAEGVREIVRISLTGQTDGVWHGFVPGLAAGQVYGLRAYGQSAPDRGHRYNPHKLLLDPYAREIVGRFRWVDEQFGYERGPPADHRSPDTGDNAAFALKARVAGPLPPRHAPAPPSIAPADTILYELHVRGFTKLHPDVPPALRGTFAGLAQPAVIEYLRALGITAISLLPVHYHLDEAPLLDRGLSNYWGYNTLGFFCPDPRLSSTPGDPTATRAEFRAMVDALHGAGIEVILDVVYNHTAEGDESGPTLSFRGLDNAVYYRLLPGDRARCVNDSGCGNTLNVEHPRVTQLVLDSLRYWVAEMGVDGFRFDLAPALGRTAHGFDPHAGFFVALMQDPVLAHAKLIAEPWDLGAHGYQLGRFPRRFAEWNDRFRDAARLFWLSRGVGRAEFARRLTASADRFHHSGRRPTASVNYVTSHDGFTLHDVVTYAHRRNHDNGEDNRDGHAENFSVNCGIEGPTREPATTALRARLRQALAATVLLAQGTPMWQAGDEIGRTQRGNNNAYCQDNETSWLDWSRVDDELLAFVRRLIALRRSHRALRLNHWLSDGSAEAGLARARWWTSEGNAMTVDDWHDPGRHCFGLELAPADAEPVVLLINAEPDAVDFIIPPGDWRCELVSCTPRMTSHRITSKSAALPPQSLTLLVGEATTAAQG